MPLSLSDDEYIAVQAAAAPIHPLQRDAFLKALATELERHPVVGPALSTVALRTCSGASAFRPSGSRPSRDISGRARQAAEARRSSEAKARRGGRDASNAVPTTLTLARPDASPVTMRSCRAWFL